MLYLREQLQRTSTVALTTVLALTNSSSVESMMAILQCSTPISLQLAILACLCLRCEEKRLQRQQYYLANKDAWKAYTAANQERIRANRVIWQAEHKDSMREYNKAYREANREQLNAYDRARPNKDERLEQRKAYRQANPEHVRELERASYWRNRENKLEQMKASYATHKPARQAANKEWREENREHIKAQQKEYQIANKDRLAKQKKEYHLANRERLLAKQKEFYTINRKRLLEEKKEYWAANREVLVEKHRRWAQANPEYDRAKKQQRRAAKANAPLNDFTAFQWRSMQEHYNHRCVYCGKRAKGKLTQDHITPLKKGGSHTLSNIIPACRSCNSKKYTGPPLSPVQPLLLSLPLEKKRS
jgi:5-methylcytosine-specific restriction endonuclease McrA